MSRLKDRFVWVWLAVALAGCESGAAGNELGLCSAVCRCESQLPGQQQACVDECVQEAELALLSSACERCVFENSSSCEDLMTKCEDPCSPPRPLPEPGGPEDL